MRILAGAMRPFVLNIPDVLLARLARLPAALEREVRLSLCRMAVLAGEHLGPSPGGSLPLGTAPWRARFRLGAYRFTYEVHRTRGMVRLVEMHGPEGEPAGCEPTLQRDGDWSLRPCRDALPS